MAELADLLTETISGAITAVDNSEIAHLKGQITAVQSLNGKEPTVDDLLKLFDAGYLPDYYAGEEITVVAQMTVTAQHEQTINANGGVAVGPLTLQGGLSETDRSGSNTNLAVTVRLARQSRSAGLQNVFSALSANPAAPALPTGTAALPG